ncbi:MAG: CpsB/CapC family capsule biosynthesis tyrosine phosphatase [Gemmatimonadota bacterium]
MMQRSSSPDYADIHNHLLPAVDDGAGSLDESLRHLHAMAACGVTRLAFSSHLHGWIAYEHGALARRLDDLEAAYDRVRAACAERDDVPADLVFGQEILVSDPETARRLFDEPRVGFRGTDYALIEFGFHLPDDPLGVIRAVRASGRRPIIAHPERYNRDGTPADADEILAWRAEGALLQANAGSLLGRHGDGLAEHAWRLLARGAFDLIASDHHGDARPDSPDRVAARLADRGAQHLVEPLLCENPRRILGNRGTRRVEPWSPQAVA